jgi:NTP pyrophosphatase (non-canonical NTP hydrolase)
MYNILARAQNTYGYANQVSVAAEECCELAAVCNKYVRYPDHDSACVDLRQKLVNETADVVVILNHLYMIFNITPEEQEKAIDAKLARLVRWMDKSPDLFQSTIDRVVDTD